MEILEGFSGCSSNRVIFNEKLIKKRPRPSSSATTTGGGDGGENSYNSLITWSSTSQEEEDDMDVANCLILLARGADSNYSSSRKFTEIPSTSDVKVGIYVYECKTCSRVFPSFQALGGHRASHKKPKPTMEKTNNNYKVDIDDKQEAEQVIISKLKAITSSPTTQLMMNNNVTNNKVHECSICGAEFVSGQALGGHMRRHRSSSSSLGKDSTDHANSITRNVFVLDLNMPAPLEDDHHKHKTTLETAVPLDMFSGGKLVDCHY